MIYFSYVAISSHTPVHPTRRHARCREYMYPRHRASVIDRVRMHMPILSSRSWFMMLARQPHLSHPPGYLVVAVASLADDGDVLHASHQPPPLAAAALYHLHQFLESPANRHSSADYGARHSLNTTANTSRAMQQRRGIYRVAIVGRRSHRHIGAPGDRRWRCFHSFSLAVQRFCGDVRWRLCSTLPRKRSGVWARTHFLRFCVSSSGALPTGSWCGTQVQCPRGMNGVLPFLAKVICTHPI